MTRCRDPDCAARDGARHDVEEFSNYIGGEWVTSRTGSTFDNVNPADTPDIVGRFPGLDVGRCARRGRCRSGGVRGLAADTDLEAREGALGRPTILEANAPRSPRELTREEGKSVALAKDEVLRSAQTLRFYAIEGQSFSGETFPNDDADMLVYTQREPLGVVTVITPWNFPVSIPARKIAPALDHRQHGGLQALLGRAAERLSACRGVGRGRASRRACSTSSPGAPRRSARPSPNPPVVRAISFTGSTAAGEQIHRSCRSPRARRWSSAARIR